MKIWKMIPILLLACCVLIPGPTGCSKTTLAPAGVYQGDTFLYQSEKTIVAVHKQFQQFVAWEHQYREILPVEVSRAADVIRLNAKKWIDSANALHDAYVAVPSAENRDKFALAMNIIDSALSEAAKYMAKNKSRAPHPGLDVKPQPAS